jgi:hypothetical protein
MSNQQRRSELDDGAEQEAATNRERLLAYAQAADRLRALPGRALDAIESGLDHKDPRVRLAAAAMVLKATSLDAIGRSTGQTTAVGVRRERALGDLLASLG